MQEQLFKLYHNERDIETLAEELRVRQKDLERLVSGQIIAHNHTSSVTTCTYAYH